MNVLSSEGKLLHGSSTTSVSNQVRRNIVNPSVRLAFVKPGETYTPPGNYF